ncbi:MAG TPA: SGNH/GDSL hydrolase family protein [Euzebya sp.]|nr:SGNH/GDSL hydrolase family protein [Euzebya sp.]
MSPVGRFRAGATLTRGQVDPYRRVWLATNADALRGGPADGPLWVVLGDSAAQGVGASDPSHGWVGQVRRRLEARDGHPWRVVNLSVSGARAHDVLDEQLPALRRLRQPIDLVVCAIGGNDMYRSTSRQIRDRFTRLVRSLPVPGELGAGQRTILTTLPQGLARRRAGVANTIVRTLAPARGIEVADLWATTGPPWQGKYAEDHFHPNDVGYGHWADAISPVVLAPHPPGPGQTSDGGERRGEFAPPVLWSGHVRRPGQDQRPRRKGW